jgi:hypothetical protein
VPRDLRRHSADAAQAPGLPAEDVQEMFVAVMTQARYDEKTTREAELRLQIKKILQSRIIDLGPAVRMQGRDALGAKNVKMTVAGTGEAP